MLPTDEPADLTSSESSQAAPTENIASSDLENEQIAPISNAEVDAGRSEQTPRATTNNPSHEPVDLLGSESSQAAQADNAASSHTENENRPVSNAGIDAGSSKQTRNASTNNSSGQRERQSLPSSTPFPKQ